MIGEIAANLEGPDLAELFALSSVDRPIVATLVTDVTISGLDISSDLNGTGAAAIPALELAIESLGQQAFADFVEPLIGDSIQAAADSLQALPAPVTVKPVAMTDTT